MQKFSVKHYKRMLPAIAISVGGLAAAVWVLWYFQGCRAFIAQSPWCPFKGASPWEADYLVFWAAGKLALAGTAASAYKPWILNLVAQVGDRTQGTGSVWAYPPVFLLVMAPLALVGAAVSATLFQTATAMLAASAALLTGLRGKAALMVLLSPAMLVSFIYGQNGAMTGAILVAGFWLVPGRPVIGGLLLGLCVVKPHMAVLAPVALMASGKRTAFLSASLTALSAVIVSMVVFGPVPWHAFFSAAPIVTETLLKGWHTALSGGLVVSPMSSLDVLGASLKLAAAVQIAVTLVCVWVTWRAWRIPNGTPEARLALTLALGLLATGYGFIYDMEGVSIALLMVASVHWRNLGWARAAALATAWAWPGLQMAIIGITGRQLPLGTAALVAASWVCWRLLRENAGAFAERE